jgi:hypothetical protein
MTIDPTGKPAPAFILLPPYAVTPSLVATKLAAAGGRLSCPL